MSLKKLHKYKPNKISINDRKTCIFSSLFLIFYGGVGIYANDLILPAKRHPGIHFHDTAALLLYGAFLCAALVMLSVVVDHYDERNNEEDYQSFAGGFTILGWGLFVAAFIYHLHT